VGATFPCEVVLYKNRQLRYDTTAARASQTKEEMAKFKGSPGSGLGESEGLERPRGYLTVDDFLGTKPLSKRRDGPCKTQIAIQKDTGCPDPCASPGATDTWRTKD